MWLLALVLPLQGSAVGVFAVMGPSHLHKPAEPALVLTDFRRWRPSPGLQTHVVSRLGHAHASAAPQRHFHDPLDGGVVGSGDIDASGPLDADEARGASLSPAAVLAMIPAAPVWAPRAGPDALAERPLWALRTSFTEPLDRPPRRG